jgi:hypothetical protein
MELSIPERHLAALKYMVPELGNYADGKAYSKAWKWFMRDPLSKAYRVHS